MFKYFIAAVLLMLLLVRTPVAKKIRLGDLPGDVRIHIKRFKLHLPFTSTVLVVAVLFVLSRVLKIL
jgi:Protein of unknown function (DUF2905)